MRSTRCTLQRAINVERRSRLRRRIPARMCRASLRLTHPTRNRPIPLPPQDLKGRPVRHARRTRMMQPELRRRRIRRTTRRSCQASGRNRRRTCPSSLHNRWKARGRRREGSLARTDSWSTKAPRRALRTTTFRSTRTSARCIAACAIRERDRHGLRRSSRALRWSPWQGHIWHGSREDRGSTMPR